VERIEMGQISYKQVTEAVEYQAGTYDFED
jgi:hypothetical protein